MKKPNDWGSFRPDETGAHLNPGAHVGVIINAYTALSKNSKEMLVSEFDIHEGSMFDGIMNQRYEASGKTKWPNQGTLRQVVEAPDGSTSKRFRAFITSVVRSNPGYEWNWQEGTLVGKSIGIIFREREYIKKDGTVGVFVEPYMACSVDSVQKGVPVPARRTLADQGLEPTTPAPSEFVSAATEDDLPF